MASLTTQCLIIGAGAAGLHCAGKLALGGDAGTTRALVIDHANGPRKRSVSQVAGGAISPILKLTPNASYRPIRTFVSQP